MTRTLLVTGAAGQLGRLVIDDLLRIGGGDKIVAGTRDPAKLADLAKRGVEIRHVDFDSADALKKGFADVDRLLIISTDAFDAPGHRLAQQQRAVSAEVVDVAVAVDIGEPADAGLADEARRAAHRGEGANRRVHPAGNDRAGVLEQLGGYLHGAARCGGHLVSTTHDN